MFPMYSTCSWTGDKARMELQEANISQQCFLILKECATKVDIYSDNWGVVDNKAAAFLMCTIFFSRLLKPLQTVNQA